MSDETAPSGKERPLPTRTSPTAGGIVGSRNGPIARTAASSTFDANHDTWVSLGDTAEEVLPFLATRVQPVPS